MFFSFLFHGISISRGPSLGDFLVHESHCAYRMFRLHLKRFIDPQYVDGLNHTAAVIVGALADFHKVLELDPQNADARKSIEVIEKTQKQGDSP